MSGTGYTRYQNAKVYKKVKNVKENDHKTLTKQ